MLASVAEFEPDADRFVFVVDDLAQVERIDEGTILRPAEVFDEAEYAALARSSDVVEFSTSVKPAVLRHLLDLGYARVLYFDPDIQVFAGLGPLLEPLETNAIALTPHWTDALPLGWRLPFELAILRFGVFNLGFIGVANAPDARAMLAWWGERVREFARIDVSSGLFVDQRWMDLVPGMFERTAIVRHRGCNVARWNLFERRLAESEELHLESGEPVIFFHFSGLDPRRPDRPFKHPMWKHLKDQPHLRKVRADYARRALEFGHLERLRISYAYRRSSGKRLLREIARRIFEFRSRWLYGSGPRSVTPHHVAAQPTDDRAKTIGKVG